MSPPVLLSGEPCPALQQPEKGVPSPDVATEPHGKVYTFDIDYTISITMFPFRQFRIGRRGWLRPWVLSVISRSPKNGAEIIDEVERISFGGWRPSPGSMYPLLEELSAEGLVQKRDDGKYELTQKGKEEVDWPFGAPMRQGRNTVENILEEMRDDVSYLEDLAKSNAEKLTTSKTKLKEITDRLSRLLV